jgi:hypothetical protein
MHESKKRKIGDTNPTLFLTQDHGFSRSVTFLQEPCFLGSTNSHFLVSPCEPLKIFPKPEGSDRSGIKVQAAFEEFQRKIRLYAISSLTQTSSSGQRVSAQLPTSTVKINAQHGQVAISIHPKVNRPVDPRFQRDMYDNWYNILIEYNKRSITQKSDVLPALSGLAMRFQQAIGDTCLAGLWSGDLKAGLLWSFDGSSNRSTTYRAPSWSWASVQTCRLRMNYNHEKITSTNHLSDIYNAEVAYRGVNVLGKGTILSCEERR